MAFQSIADLYVMEGGPNPYLALGLVSLDVAVESVSFVSIAPDPDSIAFVQVPDGGIILPGNHSQADVQLNISFDDGGPGGLDVLLTLTLYKFNFPTGQFDIPTGDTTQVRLHILDNDDPDQPTDIIVTGGQAEVIEVATAGTSVASLATIDSTPGDTFTYKVINNSNFVMGGFYGNEILVADGAQLDFEANPTQTVQVLTTDALGHKFVKDIAINILDANPDLDILTGAFVQNVQENASVQVSLFLSDFNLPEVEIVEVSGDTAFSLLGAQVGMFAPYHNFSVVFTPQDFETPADDNRDNVYDFAITVSNGLETTTRTFHFTVTNVSPETMSGTEGIDALVGTGDADLIFGLGSNDILNGAGGNDILTGGLGKDMLTGGLEADVFDFNLMTETRKGANHDVIVDFNHLDGDHIDLIDIDAKSKTIPNDHFKFIGAKAFHHKAGELHYIKKAGYLLVEGDMDGNGKADFQIEVHGVTKLGALDFNL